MTFSAINLLLNKHEPALETLSQTDHNNDLVLCSRHDLGIKKKIQFLRQLLRDCRVKSTSMLLYVAFRVSTGIFKERVCTTSFSKILAYLCKRRVYIFWAEPNCKRTTECFKTQLNRLKEAYINPQNTHSLSTFSYIFLPNTRTHTYKISDILITRSSCPFPDLISLSPFNHSS